MALRFGEFAVFPERYRLERGGERVPMEPRVFEVLVYLLAHRERVVPKAELLEKLWPNEFVSESALTRVVRDARRALGDTGGTGASGATGAAGAGRARERWIQTVHGRGFRFAGEVTESAPATARAPIPDAHPKAAVAVLPFLDYGLAPGNELFASGITEDVIAQLAKIRSLTVISRTSTALAAGGADTAADRKSRNLREIAALLGAGAILEGSVREAGGRVRIVAQLIDAATDRHLWAETYDRELTDIFAIQSEVALAIAAALDAELSPDERRRIAQPPTGNLRAYQLYLQGRYSLSRYTAEGIRKSIGYFEQAAAEDPAFALAHVGLARAYVEPANEGFQGFTPKEAFALAQESVARALALDESLGEAHGLVALLAFSLDFDWAGAEREFRRALELSPGSADILDHYGWMCMALERYDDAIRLLGRARELDPLSHASDLASALLRAGRRQEALAMAEEIIAFDPTLARGHATAGWARLLLGRVGEGVAALERAVALTPGGTLFFGQLGQAYAMSGRVAEAREVLRQLAALARTRYVSPYHVAYVHTGLGDTAAALDCLERACELRAPAIYSVKGSFLFAGLRGHPRFTALLRRMHLA